MLAADICHCLLEVVSVRQPHCVQRPKPLVRLAGVGRVGEQVPGHLWWFWNGDSQAAVLLGLLSPVPVARAVYPHPQRSPAWAALQGSGT